MQVELMSQLVVLTLHVALEKHLFTCNKLLTTRCKIMNNIHIVNTFPFPGFLLFVSFGKNTLCHSWLSDRNCIKTVKSATPTICKVHFWRHGISWSNSGKTSQLHKNQTLVVYSTHCYHRIGYHNIQQTLFQLHLTG